MRSVADSNRRTRFCRPLPNHSANRPKDGFSRFGWAKVTKFSSDLQEKFAVISKRNLLRPAIIFISGPHNFLQVSRRPLGHPPNLV